MAVRPRPAGAPRPRRPSEAPPTAAEPPKRPGPPWWPMEAWAALAGMEIARSERHRYRLCLIALQLDPAAGHAAPHGEEVAEGVAQTIRGRCRAGDLLVQGQGAQWYIVAPYCGWRGGAALAEDLRWAVAAARRNGHGAATVSAGVAERLSGESLEEWQARAQGQLASAVAAGRNQVAAAPRGQPEPESGVVQLVWRDAYLSGHAGIDEQHLTMFRLANRVLQAGMGELESPEAQESLLCELDLLLHHVAEHFRDEEEVLAEKRYAKLKQHRLAHKKLLDRASLLRDRVRAGHADLGLLTDFLAREVVVRHMLTADREYFATLHKGK